jgi:hypothetical protein
MDAAKRPWARSDMPSPIGDERGTGVAVACPAISN